jgi:hypothetical protein
MRKGVKGKQREQRKEGGGKREGEVCPEGQTLDTEGQKMPQPFLAAGIRPASSHHPKEEESQSFSQTGSSNLPPQPRFQEV